MTATPRTQPLMSFKDVATHLNVSRRTVGRLVTEGDLLITRINGRILFQREDVDRFIFEHSDHAPLMKRRPRKGVAK